MTSVKIRMTIFGGFVLFNILMYCVSDDSMYIFTGACCFIGFVGALVEWRWRKGGITMEFKR